MRIVSLLAVTAAMAVAAPAYAQTYVSGTQTFNSVGDQIGSNFDIVTLSSVSGTFTTPGLYDIYNVSFTVGTNATVAATTNGSFPNNSITIGGTPYTFAVPYTIAISSSDTLTFNPFTTTMGGLNFAFNLLSLSSGGATVTGVLRANVSAVPEPAAWAMMLFGFGAIGFAMRRRNAVRTSVSYG